MLFRSVTNGASPCAGSNTAWYVGSGVSIFGPRLVTNYSDYRDYTYGVMAVDTNGGTLRLYGSGHTGTSTNYISFTGSNGQVRADGGFYIENPVAKLILEGRFGPKDIIPVDVDKQGHFSFNRVVH